MITNQHQAISKAGNLQDVPLNTLAVQINVVHAQWWHFQYYNPLSEPIKQRCGAVDDSEKHSITEQTAVTAYPR